jgi:hypothetical protein
MLNRQPHWPSILVLLCLIPGGGLLWISAVGVFINSIVQSITIGSDPAGSIIASTVLGFEGILLWLSAWFVFQKTTGNSISDTNLQLPYSWMHIPAVILISTTGIAIGMAIAASGNPWLRSVLLPVLTILAIVPPIWLLARLAYSSINLGPRWRALAIFGLGMSLNPLIMIFFEVLLAVIFIVTGALYLASQPGLMNRLIEILPGLDPQADPRKFLDLFTPYILNPGVLTAIFLYIALLVPLIEEFFKPLGIWLFAGSIESPAQGFALGILSGAAYSLIEGLGVSGQAGVEWPVVVSARAGTSLLHITTTGMMGWAIVSAVKQKKYLRLLACYTSVVMIHGIWNAAAAGIGIYYIFASIDQNKLIDQIIFSALGGLFVLGVGLMILIIRSKKLLVE